MLVESSRKVLPDTEFGVLTSIAQIKRHTFYCGEQWSNRRQPDLFRLMLRFFLLWKPAYRLYWASSRCHVGSPVIEIIIVLLRVGKGPLSCNVLVRKWFGRGELSMDRQSWKMWIIVGNSLHINLPSQVEFVVVIFDPFLICQCSRGCERKETTGESTPGIRRRSCGGRTKEENVENKVGRTALKSDLSVTLRQ